MIDIIDDIIDRLNVFQVLLGCFGVTGVFINGFIVKKDWRWAFLGHITHFGVITQIQRTIEVCFGSIRQSRRVLVVCGLIM